MFDPKRVKKYYKIIEPHVDAISPLEILLGYEHYKVCNNNVYNSSMGKDGWEEFKKKYNIKEKKIENKNKLRKQ